MKVVHIFTQFPNPYQPYNERLIERQRKAGIECSVFAFYRGKKNGASFFDRLFFFWKGLMNLSFVLQFQDRTHTGLLKALLFVGRLAALLKTADVMHFHHVQNLTPDHLVFISLLKRPIVISLRGSDALVSPLVSDTARTSFERNIDFANGIHTVSAHLAKAAIRYGAQEDKVFVIRRTPEEPAKISTRASYDGNVIVLSSIGRYNWAKGYTFLLQAVRLLADRGYNVRLNIIGDGSEEERFEILYWIDFLKLTDRVRLCGYKSSLEINSILEETHVYVQPSVSEGIPNTLTRVLANEIPVVVTNVGGIPEVVTEDNGVIIPPGDSKSIADAVQRIVSDKDFRDNLYKKPPLVSFDAKSEIEKYIKFYEFSILDFNKKSS